MDADRFDMVVRGLASGAGSRRQALRVVGAALVGGALATRSGWTHAKPKPGKCGKDEQCPDGIACVDGECGGCPEGLTLCFDETGQNGDTNQYQCVDLQTNSCHCGTCQNRCPDPGIERCCGGGVCGGGGGCVGPQNPQLCDPKIPPVLVS
jgi:hypothetical protein